MGQPHKYPRAKRVQSSQEKISIGKKTKNKKQKNFKERNKSGNKRKFQRNYNSWQIKKIWHPKYKNRSYFKKFNFLYSFRIQKDHEKYKLQ